jgi:hypothetical protein
MLSKHASIVATLATLSTGLTSGTSGQDVAQPIPLPLAAQYFKETRIASERDAGQLWGMELYGPMLFVDRRSRSVVANMDDPEGILKPVDQVWAGTLPKELNIANTAFSWAGRRWTMIIWPPSEHKANRLPLLMHESFHRIQPDLGFSGRDAANPHLETMEGRIWIQMEWRALAAALREEQEAKRQAVQDALLFRTLRQQISTTAAASERSLEHNEGLAEYTGLKLGTGSDAEMAVAAQCALRSGHQRRSLGRSFAYISGPAYGLLLDASSNGWRAGVLDGEDFGELLKAAYAIEITLGETLQEEAERRAEAYDGADLIRLESRREAERQETISDYQRRLIEGPVLVLPCTPKIRYSFNPNNVLALNAEQTVYPTARVVDVWGILEVMDGALLVKEGGAIARVQVPAPEDPETRPITGAGWRLQLETGWELTAGGREGDVTVRPAEVK